MKASSPPHVSFVKRETIKRYVALTFRAVCFLFFLFLILLGSPEDSKGGCRLSPLLFLSSLLPSAPSEIEKTFSLTPFAILSIFIIFLCFIRRRFFCHFICPLGACVDTANFFRNKSFKNKYLRHGIAVKSKFYFIFFTTFWIFTFFGQLVSSSLFNLPGLTPLAFDPIALFSRFFTTFPRPTVLILAFIFCALISPFFWRYSFCPCGALQEGLNFPFRFIYKKVRSQRTPCTKNSVPPRKSGKSRRTFFRILGTSTLCYVTIAFFGKLSGKISTRFFRPLGAIPERDFLLRCARCGRCTSVCPNKIIQPLQLSTTSKARTSFIQGSLEESTPVVNFELGFCEKDCVRCTEVCPTGALTSISITEKSKYPLALARFDLTKCMLYFGRECSICRRQCPYNAISFEWSDEAYANVPVIDATHCTGCGRCVTYCPGEPLDLEEPNEEQIEDVDVPPKRNKALTLTQR